MLVTLVKAQGASNKGKHKRKIPFCVQESDFYHQLISILFIFRLCIYIHVHLDLCFSVLDQIMGHHYHIITDCLRGLIMLVCMLVVCLHVCSWSNHRYLRTGYSIWTTSYGGVPYIHSWNIGQPVFLVSFPIKLRTICYFFVFPLHRTSIEDYSCNDMVTMNIGCSIWTTLMVPIWRLDLH